MATPSWRCVDLRASPAVVVVVVVKPALHAHRQEARAIIAIISRSHRHRHRRATISCLTEHPNQQGQQSFCCATFSVLRVLAANELPAPFVTELWPLVGEDVKKKKKKRTSRRK